MHKSSEVWVYDQQSFTCFQWWLILWFQYNKVIQWFVSIYVQRYSSKSTVVVVYTYNGCYVISGQIYTSSTHYFKQTDKHFCSFTWEQYLFVQHHFVANAANAPGGGVFGSQSIHSTFQHKSLWGWGDMAGSLQYRFLQGKRKSLNTAGYYFLWNNAIYPH